MFGRTTGFFGVIECAKRFSLQIHMVWWGGVPPHIVQRVAYTPELVNGALAAALSSVYETEVPGAVHMANCLRRAAHVPQTRFAERQVDLGDNVAPAASRCVCGASRRSQV